jgi:pyruvate dehydrogenase E2 component (dihydrolipoamide acetyltransferase)
VAKDFKLPDLGEGIEGGDIVQVLVAEGDTIEAEQAVVEIETDKAVLEVPCPFAGKVTKVHVKAGEKAKVGQTLVSVEAGEKAATEAPKKPPAGQSRKAAEPRKDETRREAASSEAVAQEARQGEDRGRPSAPPRKPPPARRDTKPSVVEEEEEPAERAEAPRRRSTASPTARDAAARQEPVPAGPATRRLARELGVDLQHVAREHDGQRISEEHVKSFVRKQMTAPPSTAGFEEPPLPDFGQWGPVERVPMSSLSRKSAQQLSTAWLAAPHVTQFDVADITDLESLRKRYRERGPAKDIKLTVTAFVVKAAAAALKAYPSFNASIDAQAEEIVLKQYYHIGVAVDTEAGLIVPVLRDVDQKRVLDIAAEMEELADRTRRRKIKLEELRGGTFTITNLGGIGGTAFTPIINHPEVAILGLARSRQEPVLEGDELRNRLILPLCLSYDHRVVNGADGARFVRKLASLLEDPELLLLEG